MSQASSPQVGLVLWSRVGYKAAARVLRDERHALFSATRLWHTLGRMRELATLRMDTGREVRVEVVREDAARDEIVVRRTAGGGAAPTRDLIAVIDTHLPTASRHPAGTTDRLLAADRDRPY